MSHIRCKLRSLKTRADAWYLYDLRAPPLSIEWAYKKKGGGSHAPDAMLPIVKAAELSLAPECGPEVVHASSLAHDHPQHVVLNVGAQEQDRANLLWDGDAGEGVVHGSSSCQIVGPHDKLAALIQDLIVSKDHKGVAAFVVQPHGAHCICRHVDGRGRRGLAESRLLLLLRWIPLARHEALEIAQLHLQ